MHNIKICNFNCNQSKFDLNLRLMYAIYFCSFTNICNIPLLTKRYVKIKNFEDTLTLIVKSNLTITLVLFSWKKIGRPRKRNSVL